MVNFMLCASYHNFFKAELEVAIIVSPIVEENEVLQLAQDHSESK